jgi:hypothetical protein
MHYKSHLKIREQAGDGANMPGTTPLNLAQYFRSENT